MRRALRLIAQGGLDDDDVEAFASRLGVGGRQLRRLFESHLGASPAAVARANRAHFARRLLDETDLKIADVAFSAGFRGLRQFNHAMRATFRAAPRELRARRKRAVASEAGLVFRLPYRPPLDWDALFAFLAARATPGVEAVDAHGYRRTLQLGDAVGTLAVRPEPESAHAVLTLRLSRVDGLQTIVARARRLFDLDADPHEIGRHLATSAALAPLVKRRPGLRVPGAWDGFELAVRAILGQQVSVRGATTLAGRLVAKFGAALAETNDAGLTHLFPTPAALAAADVAAIGLPRARAEAIRALARAVADGSLALDGGLELDALVERLCEIPGIGPWTAHYVAMRACGETDAFPAGDLVLRRAYGGPATDSSARCSRRARPGDRGARTPRFSSGRLLPRAPRTAPASAPIPRRYPHDRARNRSSLDSARRRVRWRCTKARCARSRSTTCCLGCPGCSSDASEPSKRASRAPARRASRALSTPISAAICASSTRSRSIPAARTSSAPCGTRCARCRPGRRCRMRRWPAAIGRPDAARAVGAACGANPIWLVVPCHRAIGSDGRLVGYAGGLERKGWLLAPRADGARRRGSPEGDGSGLNETCGRAAAGACMRRAVRRFSERKAERFLSPARPARCRLASGSTGSGFPGRAAATGVPARCGRARSFLGHPGFDREAGAHDTSLWRQHRVRRGARRRRYARRARLRDGRLRARTRARAALARAPCAGIS